MSGPDRIRGRVRELLLSRDPDACIQAVELTAALGDPGLYSELLRGCRLVEGTLMGNALFPGGDWQTRMSAVSLRGLLSLIATAPEAAALHPSLRRGAIDTLRIGVRQGLDIPHDAAALTALTTVNLRGSGLRDLPDSITHLAAAERLELSQNKLSTLPEPVTRMARLRLLDLSFNPLSDGLPAAIGRLAALESLVLVGTQLTDLPAELGRLERLRKLDLSRTMTMRALPAAVFRLPALEVLVLRGSRIRVRAEDVAQLPALKTLQVNRGLYRDARYTREQLCAARPGLVVNL